MRTDIIERKNEILQWIEENQSKAYICRELGCKQDTLNGYLRKLGIVYVGNMGAKGKKTDAKRKSFFDLSKGVGVPSHRLKLRLLEDGLKQHQCEECGLDEWMGQLIPIELHHIDGNRFNNNLENLQLLCPNCHALTPNYSCKKRDGLVAER
jgi:5-methylcytosine-specific restriction endonuclease McrA